LHFFGLDFFKVSPAKMRFLYGSCSETEVSEQLFYIISRNLLSISKPKFFEILLLNFIVSNVFLCPIRKNAKHFYGRKKMCWSEPWEAKLT